MGYLTLHSHAEPLLKPLGSITISKKLLTGCPSWSVMSIAASGQYFALIFQRQFGFHLLLLKGYVVFMSKYMPIVFIAALVDKKHFSQWEEMFNFVLLQSVVFRYNLTKLNICHS